MTTTSDQNNGAVSVPEPIGPGRGATILGPRNVPVELENPDVLVAPETDAGTVQSLKWPFALSHNRVLSGGWARETTTRELPVSTEIAGVNMRLTPGGIRELHWHKEAEWAYVIAGICRVSILDEEGQLFIDDVSVGDLWYFPAGLPHSIQALADGVEFLLVFDSGDFSENETFLIPTGSTTPPVTCSPRTSGSPSRRLTRCRPTSPTPATCSPQTSRRRWQTTRPPTAVSSRRCPTPGTCTPRSRLRPGRADPDHRLAQLHRL
jgi:quercetin dioxygenase-like cupin family protein